MIHIGPHDYSFSRMVGIGLVALACGLAWPAQGQEPSPTPSAQTESPYDLIFRSHTLDDLSQGRRLLYQQTVKGSRESQSPDPKKQTPTPPTDKVQSGSIELLIEPEQMARLTFWQGEKHRHLLDFDASVGNPLFLYFIETTVRDMAAHTRGSPFYIRNRIKESLGRSAEITEEKIQYKGKSLLVRHIVLRPFSHDKRRNYMGSFADLLIRVSVSDHIPGWYYRLETRLGSQSPEQSPYWAIVQAQEE